MKRLYCKTVSEKISELTVSEMIASRVYKIEYQKKCLCEDTAVKAILHTLRKRLYDLKIK
ncbi:hypothetical protein Fsol_00269 [Candidatus Fokinia solitaria]|uniref:Uncharacterized protein n=1 Tax=Candidatus Fokinia solitaria TaxID=1802984 RepID=A0A2U8BRV7_9RICK|nr:hypothetical protein Fsol_00269 [Candidatus Fokinia solitaria]